MSVVLIVEDDVLLRAQIARGLHKLPGVDVIEAGSVRESIELADGVPLDLVVSDLHLPDGSALHLLPHLVQHGARVPAILISGCVERYAKQLPENMKVFEKPLHLAELRDAVREILGCDEARSPFSLADYLQLAGLGRHSVEIDVNQSGEPFGSIFIYDGQPWTALDALGAGIDAFLRMMVAGDLSFDCAAAPAVRPERTLEGSCEGMLLDAARLIDERRRSPAPAPTRTRTRRSAPPLRPPGPASVTIPPAPPRRIAEASSKIASLDADFARLYDDGIDALLGKRYADALALFLRAQKIRSTPTLEANLNRLRSLGVS